MRIVLDIETNLAHDKIWLCITKNIDTGETITWKAASNLSEYLKGATLIIGQNILAFDARLLNSIWKTKIVLNQCYDTLLVSRLLEPSRENGHSLASWGTTLGLEKIDYLATWQWMNERRETYKGECYDVVHMGLLETYCRRDVEVTEKLFHELEAQLAAKKFSNESVQLEHKVAAIISKQEQNGFKLDTIYATSLLAGIKGKLDSLYEEMQLRWPPVVVERISEKTGKRLQDGVVVFNPGSRKQIGEKLIELGWKPEKKTETGQPMVDEAVLDEILIKERKKQCHG